MAIFDYFRRRRHFLKSLGAVPEIIIAAMSTLSLRLKGASAPGRAHSLKKLLSSERAANEMVGQMMLLAITVIGIGTITVVGVPTILSLQDMANARNGEQSLTVIDSQASKAIMGFSPGQTNNINLGGGTITVLPNSSTNPSYINVSSNNFSLVIPMGKIEYTLGDRIVAYEGGGMWTKYPSGKALMLSPPALHFNGVMLSLPDINISGSGSVGGKGVASLSVTRKNSSVLFPNPNPKVTTTVTPQTVQYNWNFTYPNNASWTFSSVQINCGGTCTVTAGNKSGDGNPVSNGSLFANLTVTANGANSKTGNFSTSWRSPNFSWINGTPTILPSLNFSLREANYSGSSYTGTFNVTLIKPDGTTSLIYQTTPISPSTQWQTLSNLTMAKSDFSQSNNGGNYSILLNATLNVSTTGSSKQFGNLEIRWSNPNITLNYNITQINTDTNRSNPVNLSKAGNIYVNITSDFYDAWATYANDMGYANVTTDPTNKTVSLNLSTAPNNLGKNVSITNPIVFRGLPDGSDPLNDFSFMLLPFGGKLDWDIRTKTGQQKLIFDVTATNQSNPVTINVGYQNGTGNTAETWNYTGYFPVQGEYFYIDMLNTSLYLTYSNITVSANNSNSCQPFGGMINQGQQYFNSTGYLWGGGQQTTQYTWGIWPSETWTYSLTGSGTNLGYGVTSSKGNPAPSLYSSIGQSSNYVTTFNSSNFSSTGTLTSASLKFDLNASLVGSASGVFYVNLVKPDGSISQIFPTTSLSNINWATYNTNILVNNFTLPGNYSLKLISTAITGTSSSVNVNWDNIIVTLNSSVLTNSLYNITEHYFSLLNQDGELSFGDCGPYQPAANSTMLMDYNATGGLTYLQISDNQVDATIS